MPLPTFGLGDGASFAFGADGGPIHSSDQFNNDFKTGSFGGEGASLSSLVIPLVAILILGIILWLLISNR